MTTRTNSSTNTPASMPTSSQTVVGMGGGMGGDAQGLSKPLAVTAWIAQVLTALILLQTLFFKFTGAPESIYIFKTMGLEPVGRYGSGVAELVAAVLLLIPKARLNAIGAGLSLGVIVGALGSHLTKLGIAIPYFDKEGNQLAENDGGLLFGLACVVLVASIVVLVIRRRQLPVVGSRF